MGSTDANFCCGLVPYLRSMGRRPWHEPSTAATRAKAVRAGDSKALGLRRGSRLCCLGSRFRPPPLSRQQRMASFRTVYYAGPMFLGSRSTYVDARAPSVSETVSRRNWWLHVLEGTALIGASAAINPNTVGSALVQSLGGSAWMVALMPMATHVRFLTGSDFERTSARCS